MAEQKSVSDWIAEIQVGDEAAAQKVWNHFYSRLIALARRKLHDTPRRDADEDLFCMTLRSREERQDDETADWGTAGALLGVCLSNTCVEPGRFGFSASSRLG